MTGTRQRPPGRLVAARPGAWLLPGTPPRRSATTRTFTTSDEPEFATDGARPPARRLAGIAVALVLGLIAGALGLGLSVLDDTPDDPEVRVMWFLSWAFPDVGDKGPWERHVCNDATDRINAAIAAEDERLHDQFAPDWIAHHAWNPDYRSTVDGIYATVSVDGQLEIHEADESGFNPYVTPDFTWTFTLRHNWLREWAWCITDVRTHPTG